MGKTANSPLFCNEGKNRHVILLCMVGENSRRICLQICNMICSTSILYIVKPKGGNHLCATTSDSAVTIAYALSSSSLSCAAAAVVAASEIAVEMMAVAAGTMAAAAKMQEGAAVLPQPSLFQWKGQSTNLPFNWYTRTGHRQSPETPAHRSVPRLLLLPKIRQSRILGARKDKIR